MKSNTRFSTRHYLSSTLIALGMWIAFSNAMIPNPMNMVFADALTIAALLLIVNTDKTANTKLTKFALLVFSVWILAVACSLISSKSKALNLGLLELLIYNVFTVFMLSNKKLPLLPLKCVFYVIGCFLLYNCAFVGVERQELFYYSALGYMTSVLLCISMAIQYLDFRDNNSVSLLPSILAVVVSFYSWSRTGMICSIVYMLLIWLISIRKIENPVRRYLLYAIIAGAIVWAYGKSLSLLSDSEMFLKFEEYGLDTSGRNDIWHVYFGDFNLMTILFGANLEMDSTLAAMNSNLHNSFLQLHSIIGFSAFVVWYYIIKSLWFQWKNNKFFFVLMFLLIVRGFFDALFFFGVYDFALYLFIINHLRSPLSNNNFKVKLV